MRALILAAALAALPTVAASAPAARQPRAFVLNQWGGVVSCDFTHNPLATRRMRAYCAGAAIPAADPARFDCRTAEVDSEFRYCGRPFPVRAR